VATKWRLPSIDVPMTVSALLLVGIGLSIVFSATTVPGQHEGLWAKQLVWFGFALLAAWLAAAIHYRLYDTFAYVLYGISILLLVAVLGFGTSAMGAKRWLELGPLKFQPSELAKIATVFVLARRFDDRNLDLRRIKDWLPPLFIMLVPFALVGGIMGLWLRGLAFSIPAAVGFIALAGVSVLNGVVLCNAIKERMEGGWPLGEAVTLGATHTMRAVLTTGAVAAFGFLPMAIATGAGAEVQRPLATVVISGIALSTLLTMFLLPGILQLVLRAPARRGALVALDQGDSEEPARA